MRIALDGRPLASTLTGVGHYTVELARALAAVAPSDEFTLLAPVPLEASALAEIKRHPFRNLHEIHFNSPSLNSYWWSLGLPLYLTGSSFNLFHGTNYDIPRWRLLPAVVTIHDLSLLLHSETHEQRLVERARRRLPGVARSAAMVITPSESVKREICEHLGVAADKVAVTPEAPRSIFKRVGPEVTVEVRKRLGIADNFILFVGTIEPRKNLETLIDALAEILRTTQHRPQLVVTGKTGWLMDDFFSLPRAAGLENKVCFTGYVSDADLSSLYSSCSVFVYPSKYEGFGLPPLEAMACGAPVVTSDIPVMRETVGTAARLVNPSSVQDLAGAIVTLLDDKHARERLSVLGQEHAQSFTWAETARKTHEVYERVLKGDMPISLCTKSR
jgi:glycosyltransferase involved in cell wall biosynthesis